MVGMTSYLFRSAVFAALATTALAESLPFYVATAGKQAGIFQTSINSSTGELADVERLATLGGSGFLAVSDDGSLIASTCSVDVADGKDGEMNAGVATFRVAEDGLKLLGKSAAQGRGPCYVAFDHSERMVMVANYGSGNVASFPLAESGAPETAASVVAHEGSGPHPGRQKKPHAHCIIADPANTYAYAADLGADKIFRYRINAESGQLEMLGSTAASAGAGPRHIKFGKGGKHLYALNELSLTVAVYEILEQGELRQIQEVPTLEVGTSKDGMTCSELVLTADGTRLYAGNRDTKKTGKGSLSFFSVDPVSGMIERRQVKVGGFSRVRNINLDPTEKWLIAAARQQGELRSYPLGDDGQIGDVASIVKVASPMCIVFQPQAD